MTIECAFQNFQTYQFRKSKSIIYNSFIASNFNYCPLVWHFCGAANSNKFEKLHERSLRILYNDFDLPIQSLIDKLGQGTLLSNRLKYFILEVFKSIRKLNAPCLHDMFVLNEVPYNLRTLKLEQPIRRTTNYGLRTFSYLGSKLWNEFLSDFNYTCDTEISELRSFLKQWEGPSLDPSYRNYAWTFIGWSIFIRPSLDGMYYGMALSVRPSVRPSVRSSVRPTVSTKKHRCKWRIFFKFCTQVCLGVPSINLWFVLSYLIKYAHNSIISDFSIFGIHRVIFSCDQAALQMVFSVRLSVCPSVCLSVCPSHLFDYVPIIVSSWNFQEFLPMTNVRSMQKVKVRGQRSRSQRSQPNLTVSGL